MRYFLLAVIVAFLPGCPALAQSPAGCSGSPFDIDFNFRFRQPQSYAAPAIPQPYGCWGGPQYSFAGPQTYSNGYSYGGYPGYSNGYSYGGNGWGGNAYSYPFRQDFNFNFGRSQRRRASISGRGSCPFCR